MPPGKEARTSWGRDLMSSIAYQRWSNERLGTVQAPRNAHRAVGGDEPGRRWTTAELNRLMTVAATGEFSAFVRDLFVESVQVLAAASQDLAVPTQELVAALADRTAQALTNPWPDQIARLFRGIGMTQANAFWRTEGMRHHVPGDREALGAVVELRNSLAHGGKERVTLKDVERQVRLVKRLARSADLSVRRFLMARTGREPWKADHGPLGPPFT